MCPDPNIKLNICVQLEKIRGVNVSEKRLLFDPSLPIYRFFFSFAKASVISWGVKGLFSIS